MGFPFWHHFILDQQDGLLANLGLKIHRLLSGLDGAWHGHEQPECIEKWCPVLPTLHMKAPITRKPNGWAFSFSSTSFWTSGRGCWPILASKSTICSAAIRVHGMGMGNLNAFRMVPSPAHTRSEDRSQGGEHGRAFLFQQHFILG